MNSLFFLLVDQRRTTAAYLDCIGSLVKLAYAWVQSFGHGQSPGGFALSRMSLDFVRKRNRKGWLCLFAKVPCHANNEVIQRFEILLTQDAWIPSVWYHHKRIELSWTYAIGLKTLLALLRSEPRKLRLDAPYNSWHGCNAVYFAHRVVRETHLCCFINYQPLIRREFMSSVLKYITCSWYRFRMTFLFFSILFFLFLFWNNLLLFWHHLFEKM